MQVALLILVMYLHQNKASANLESIEEIHLVTESMSISDSKPHFLWLNQKVFPEDVAEAFFNQALLRKTTGNIITVDGGNMEASLR